MADVTMPKCPFSTNRGFPPVAFQMCAVLSALPVTMRVQSGENEADMTMVVCPESTGPKPHGSHLAHSPYPLPARATSKINDLSENFMLSG